MRPIVCLLAALAGLQSQRTFRSGVDLIRIDVSVTDKDGRPAADLTAADFVVTIDGTPRRVSFARFYGPEAGSQPAPPPGAVPTYATNRASGPGRVVIFVVDLESMNPGYEKLLLETAGSLVDGLAPGDAVGLMPIPGKGEVMPQDADGKTHKISVSTKRSGLTARARRELVIAAAPSQPANPVELLAQPVDAIELPIAAATYSVRGEEATTLKQIFLIHAGAIGTDAPPEYAIAVMKDDRPVFQTNAQLTVTEQQAQTVAAAQLAPGRYRLRVAVVDAGGRSGSCEMPLSVGLRAGGKLQFSDVFVGTLGDRFAPSTRIAAGASAAALVELYAGDPAAFTDATVEFEVRSSRADAVLSRSAARVSSTDLPGRRVAEGPIATAALGAGEYTVSAVVHQDGAIIGRVNRIVQIGP